MGIGRRPILRYALLGVCGLIFSASLSQAFRWHFIPRVANAGSIFGDGEVIYRPESEIFGEGLLCVKVVAHETSTQDDNPRLGAYADVWSCQVENVPAQCQLVLSQPYVRWHKLCFCYTKINWLLLSREVVGGNGPLEQNMEAQTDSNVDYAFARFKNDSGRYAYLLYSAIDEHGEIVRPLPLAGVLAGRFEDLFGREEYEGSQVMMFQMFVVSDTKLNTSVIGKLNRDFREMRSRLCREVHSERPSG